MIPEQLELNLIPTKEQICLMCHLSSECLECCKKCKKNCSGQVCGLKCNPENEIGRWQAWRHIIREHPRYKKIVKQFNQLGNNNVNQKNNSRG
jgi:hypothetical protein